MLEKNETLTPKMDTYFAPAERADEQELIKDISLVSESPIMTGLLETVCGLLAVVNEQRQIVAINSALLEMLGIDNAQKAFGLRPGEALKCIHADEEPAGCGTTRFCSTCGAAIAMVACFCENHPIEKHCVLQAHRGNDEVSLFFSIRAHPITLNGHRFLLLYLQDITHQQQLESFERTFFHDINNMLQVIIGTSIQLNESYSPDLAKVVQIASLRLSKEVEIQRMLMHGDLSDIKPRWQTFHLKDILSEFECMIKHHPETKRKHITIDIHFPECLLTTDPSLLMRVLNNMTINALEATGDGHAIKIWDELREDTVCFHVWNEECICPDIALRIFQRNFTTKEQNGRGIGTFSMKLIGEKILGGKVSFTTSKKEGTIFTIELPTYREPAANE